MIIFDSRVAKENYKELPYVRSKSFDIAPGETAHLELSTHEQYYKRVSFKIIRQIKPEGVKDDCLSTKGYVKPYRFPNGTVAALGESRENSGKIFESVVIDRPGRYYIAAGKECNAVLGDCDRPTIVEVFIKKPCC